MTVLDLQTLALMEVLAVILLRHLSATVLQVIQAIVVKLAEIYVSTTHVLMEAVVKIALVVTMGITVNAYPGPGAKGARKILMNATITRV